MSALALCLLAACTARERPSQPVETQDSIAVGQKDTLPAVPLSEYEERVEELAMQPQRTEVFCDFFFSFLNNRRFQAERVKFPLRVCDMDGNESVIKSGRDFRAYFTWPSVDEYCLLLNDEEQMDSIQSSMELRDAEVQLLELKSGAIRAFYFHREDKLWQLTHSREYMAEGSMLEFLHFYSRFSADSVFQQQSLAAPLHYTMSDSEDEYSQIEGTLEPSQWSAFHPELPTHRITNIRFGQQLEQTDEIILAHCGIGSGMVELFTFRNYDGQWRLDAFKN